VTIKNEPWLTDEIVQKVRVRAKPWMELGVPVIEHFDSLPQVQHAKAIARKLADAADGTILVAALPADSGVTGRFDGCWTILHERVVEDGPSVVVIRKGMPKLDKYRILVPAVWQVGDTYSMFHLFDEMKRVFHDVEFVFEHDVSRIYFDAKTMPEIEADKVAWDGVLNHSPFWSEIGSELRWSMHYYTYPFAIAQRMGWLPNDLVSPDVPRPFPISASDEAFARANVPYERRQYVVIVPRASWWVRDWPAERSVRVAQWLDTQGIPTVIIGMQGVPPAVEGYTFKQCTNLLGKGNIGEVAAIMRDARIVITPDTGLLHIACGLGVPTVSTFGPSEYKHVTQPPGVVVTRKDKGCIECYKTTKYHMLCKGGVDCMKAITTTQVIEAVARYLGIHLETRPTVSLCMMVKNEMQMLPGAIASARALVDEIVVVDTGSTDGTDTWCASQLGVRLYRYDVGDEIQSFSDVRNFAFSKATGKYVAWLDACERFVDAKDLRTLVEQEHYDVYSLPVQHSSIRYVREKIVPRMFAHFLDRIHEFVDTDGLWCGTTLPALGIVRLPYQKQSRESSESRNIRLLKLQLETDPQNPRRARWLFYLGRDLCDARRFDEALPYLRQRVGLAGFWEERFNAGVLMARIYLYETKDYVRAEKTADALISMAKVYREGYYIKAESYYWRAMYPEAMKLYQECLAVQRPQNSTMWVWEDAYTWLPYDRISRIYETMSDPVKAAEAVQLALKVAPASEHGWLIERIKALSGVPTLV
jgi:glycosyltransferase involved in cell wall biosynthesis